MAFASGTVRALDARNQVTEDTFHVAAITFADTADVLFGFSELGFNGTRIAGKLDAVESKYGAAPTRRARRLARTTTQSNVAAAFELLNSTLLTAVHGYVDTSRRIVVVTLTDGKTRANSKDHAAVCAAGSTDLACGSALLEQELRRPAYTDAPDAHSTRGKLALRVSIGTPAVAGLTSTFLVPRAHVSCHQTCPPLPFSRTARKKNGRLVPPCSAPGRPAATHGSRRQARPYPLPVRPERGARRGYGAWRSVDGGRGAGTGTWAWTWTWPGLAAVRPERARAAVVARGVGVTCGYMLGLIFGVLS